MKTSRRFLSTAFFLLATSSCWALPIAVIDQQNPVGVATAVAPGNWGQSFIPTLPFLDAVEFAASSGAVTPIQAVIRSGLGGADGLQGPIVATSNLSSISTIFGTVHFDFAAPVTLTPGNTYVVEFTTGVLSTLSLGLNLSPDVYAGGLALLSGFAVGTPPLTDDDLVFTVGQHARTVLEPDTLLLSAIGGLFFLGFRRRKHLAASIEAGA